MDMGKLQVRIYFTSALNITQLLNYKTDLQVYKLVSLHRHLKHMRLV